jgi:hypothetical protein
MQSTPHEKLFGMTAMRDGQFGAKMLETARQAMSLRTLPYLRGTILSPRMYNQKPNIFAMKMFNFDREFIQPDGPNLPTQRNRSPRASALGEN